MIAGNRGGWCCIGSLRQGGIGGHVQMRRRCYHRPAADNHAAFVHTDHLIAFGNLDLAQTRFIQQLRQLVEYGDVLVVIE